MNVLLISQCTKNALTETRRILDQFAERRGDRTWQTPITQAGLDTLRKMLRKTARKNTAVACHWIRGKDHSELMWIVGDARQFNAKGAVPTNETSRDVLRSGSENDWHTGHVIKLLAGLAALMHDLGKASDNFQARLRARGPVEKNLVRHEWVSLRLFQAFVGEDDDNGWLTRLAALEVDGGKEWLARLECDGLAARDPCPFEHLPPLAAAVGWLILTHHRLPVWPAEKNSEGQWPRLGAKVVGFRTPQLLGLPGLITAHWNENLDIARPQDIESYWAFSGPLPVATRKWQARASALAQQLLGHASAFQQNWLDNPYVMHLARMALMLADHHYSSLAGATDRIQGDPDYPLFANTDRKTGAFNQRLDQHLLGVERHCGHICRGLPGVEKFLPRIARHKGFRKRAEDSRFRWQDKAYDLAVGLRERTQEQGFFGVNMASTGCGKTLANGRILYALADPDQGARFTIALGLRTLTMQTGQAYRERLHLGADDLAVRVGGAASRDLFEYHQKEAERSGSASAQSLLPEDTYVAYEGSEADHPLLKRLGHDPGVRALISAPILVCTVDHLVPATESQRGGHQIAPMLRLMTSDLVLDEPDDFDLDDLPALTRLVHWAGLLGSRVLLSSATLPPALLRGLFDAYRDGRKHYQANRGAPGRSLNICCAWFDEHDQAYAGCADGEAFAVEHQQFSARRSARLKTSPARRKGELVPVSATGSREEIRAEFARVVRDAAINLHKGHCSADPVTGKRVSFGLIRMANIEPIVDVALALYRLGAEVGHRIHLCVYHSQYPVLLRSHIEAQLDQVLDRRSRDAVFDLEDVRRRLNRSLEEDQIFIVLGSPVTEVGRDHDYDWAVVEPSSMRSIIQLAGRVSRHRDSDRECQLPNVVLLDTNLKHLEQPDQLAFRRPGFEGEGEWRLSTHSLSSLLHAEQYEAITSVPRIVAADGLRPAESLVDLEHARLAHLMLRGNGSSRVPGRGPPPRTKAEDAIGMGAFTWYELPRATLTAVLPQQQPFRYDPQRRVELVLMPDDEGDDYRLHRLDKQAFGRAPLYQEIEKGLHHRVPDAAVQGERIEHWAGGDYMERLVALADDLGMELDACARKFGTVVLPESPQGWRFHPALGFSLTH